MRDFHSAAVPSTVLTMSGVDNQSKAQFGHRVYSALVESFGLRAETEMSKHHEMAGLALFIFATLDHDEMARAKARFQQWKAEGCRVIPPPGVLEAPGTSQGGGPRRPGTERPKAGKKNRRRA